MTKILKGNLIADNGIYGERVTLVVDNGRDSESGAALYWSMEAQTKTISAPIVRSGGLLWAVAADSAEACERVLGPARV